MNVKLRVLCCMMAGVVSLAAFSGCSIWLEDVPERASSQPEPAVDSAPVEPESAPAPLPEPAQEVSRALTEAELATLNGEIGDVLRQSGFSGAALVTLGEQVLYDAGCGKADIDTGMDNVSTTAFQIGSLTKMFTAAAVEQLEKDGALSLDDTLDRYFPGYDYCAGVTVAQLLDMTAGFASDYAEMAAAFTLFGGLDADDVVWFNSSVDRIDEGDIEELILIEGLATAPGERFTYSNACYYLLGRIVEQASGMAYADYVRERLFAPAGMEASGFLEQGLDHNTGYTAGGQRAPDYVNRYVIGYSAGGIVSTTGDLARWLDTRFADEEAVPREDGYHNGWFREGEVLYHHGRTSGYTALVYWDRAAELRLILLGNMDDATARLDDIRAGVEACLHS